MGKRKMVKKQEEEEEEEEVDGKKFFGCYLLTSLCPRFKGHTYIGYTVNPRRRIRQHNGEIGCGAWRTKKKRPWEMVLCIYGFPTNVAALQFEWAWQHPFESLAVRSAAAAAATFKSISGLANKVKLAFIMLTLPAWESLNLTVNFFSTKYQNNASGCPPLPKQMKIRICSMDDLACYNDGYVSNDEGEGDEECDLNIGLKQPIDEVSAEATRMVHNRDTSDENLAEYNPRWPVNSSPIRERDRDRSLNMNDSPATTFSSFSSSYIVQDVGTSTSGEQLGADFKEGQVGGVSGHQIKIIDLFTSSPCYAIKSGSKKRRPVTALCSEIIDLTNSPGYV